MTRKLPRGGQPNGGALIMPLVDATARAEALDREGGRSPDSVSGAGGVAGGAVTAREA